MTDTPFVLGWHRPSKPDRRARLYPAPRSQRLVSVRHEHKGPVLNQGQVGACTGNDVADCLNTDPLFRHTVYEETDALDVYSLAEQILGGAGYPPEDNGATNIAAATAAVRLGWATGWTHCKDFGSFLSTLVLQPVMWASEWTEEMFTPDRSGQLHPTGPVQGGHSYEMDEIDVENRRVWMQNSWGTSWGVEGRAWLSWSDAAELWEHGEVMALHTGPTSHRQRTPRGCL